MRIMMTNTATRNRFESLLQRAHGKIHRFAYHLSGSREDAEDLTQETILRAYRAFDQYNTKYSFENWLFRITYNLFLDLKRSRRRRIQAQSYDALEDQGIWFDAIDDAPTAEDYLMAQVTDERLVKAFAELPPQHRQILLLSHVEELSYAQIAERLGIELNTVRSRLHRAHKALRQAYARVDRQSRLQSNPVGNNTTAYA
jgi:RNA polymerase sigma-70 factor (ECF subfamily)